MYTPELFKVSDLHTLQADMQRWNFATLITPDANEGPQVTHLPLLLDRGGAPFGVLAGHMARPNPHWKAFSRSRESLAIFHGPHGYISPRWYVSNIAVPTWNYVAVHAFGAPRLVEGTEGMLAHLNALIHYHEGTGAESWQLDRLPADTLAALLKGIVCFEMPIARIEGKAKLGQNRSHDDILGAMRGLQAENGAANRELIEVMGSRVSTLND